GGMGGGGGGGGGGKGCTSRSQQSGEPARAHASRLAGVADDSLAPSRGFMGWLPLRAGLSTHCNTPASLVQRQKRGASVMNDHLCPERDRLERLLLGALSDAEAESLTRHVEQCPQCEERLQQLEASSVPLLDGLPRSAAVEVPAALMEQLRGLAAAGSSELLAAGHHVGRFELLEELGAGSFARVFRAWDPELKRI